MSKEAQERLQSYLDRGLVGMDAMVRYAQTDNLWPTSAGARLVCRDNHVSWATWRHNNK